MVTPRFPPAWARRVLLPGTRFSRASLRRRSELLIGRIAPHWGRILQLTTAAVLAYLCAKAIDPTATDLTGPLTALLVVQSSLTQSLTSGIGRVAAVLTGVLVAVVLAIWFGLTWWSLGIAIGAALTLAYLMDFGDHILETPISAMLILGVSQHDVAAETRIINTLIGAGVGMAFNLAFPPTVRLNSAQEAVRKVARSASDVLHRAARELEQAIDRRQIDAWLRDIHAVLPRVAQAEGVISDAQAARRFNPRALTTVDSLPILSHGLTSLDGAVLAVRQTLMAFQQEAPDLEAEEGEHAHELRRAFAVVFSDMGDCVAAYGELTIAEAEGRDREAEQALAQTLEILRDTRAMLTELVMIDPAEDTSSWLLRGSILAGIESVLTELDVQTRVRMMTGAMPKIKPLLDTSEQVMNRVWLNSLPWRRPPR